MKILCIGGPLDGQLMPANGAGVHPNTRNIDNGSGTDPNEVTYTLRSISADGETAIRFYTAEGTSPYGAIVRVFSAYAKATKGKVNGN